MKDHLQFYQIYGKLLSVAKSTCHPPRPSFTVTAFGNNFKHLTSSIPTVPLPPSSHFPPILLLASSIPLSKMDVRNPQTPITAPRPLRPLQSSSPKRQYLIIYNFVSALLWLVVLGRVLALVPLIGFGKVYMGVGPFAKWTQTLALLEVVHAALGKCYILFLFTCLCFFAGGGT